MRSLRLINVMGAGVLALAAACTGHVPATGDDDVALPDAAPEPTPDAGAEPLIITVSGTALDYEGAMQVPAVPDPVAGTTLTSAGLTPALTTTSGVDGAYALSAVPPGSVFYFDATPPAALTSFRPTVNAAVTVAEESVARDAFLVSTGFVNRNYTAVLGAASPAIDTAIVFVELTDTAGLPLAGLEPAQIVLEDGLGAPVAGLGPYFVGPTGEMDDNLAIPTSTLAAGRTRAGFLDVPEGDYTLRVTYLVDAVEIVAVATFTATPNGATLVTVGGGGVPAPVDGPLTFTADVYPALQRASAGGLSCAACHTAGGSNPNLQFDLPAADVYAAINNGAIVNLATPDASLLLTKPLYEVPPNHPNATFASTADPVYQTWLRWITDGAAL